jgi:hypothetical protein
MNLKDDQLSNASILMQNGNDARAKEAALPATSKGSDRIDSKRRKNQMK